jgi:hypothetical protein
MVLDPATFALSQAFLTGTARPFLILWRRCFSLHRRIVRPMPFWMPPAFSALFRCLRARACRIGLYCPPRHQTRTARIAMMSRLTLCNLIKAKVFAEGFRSEYHLVTNSCMMFAHKVNHAGGWSWFGPIPVWNSNPKAEMERGLLNNYTTYNPRSDRFRESVWQISE